MEILSALLALSERNLPVTDGFPSQKPVTRSFGGFLDRCLNKGLGKQLRRQRKSLRWELVAIRLSNAKSLFNTLWLSGKGFNTASNKPNLQLEHIDGLMQDCSISIANALKILQPCFKPSIYWLYTIHSFFAHHAPLHLYFFIMYVSRQLLS